MTSVVISFENAEVYRTVKISSGVYVSGDGRAAINITGITPEPPSPADAEWVACDGNWIYFHKKSDGTLYEDTFVNRMLSTVLVVHAKGSTVRVGITRDSSNYFYTHQIIDKGKIRKRRDKMIFVISGRG